MYLLCQYVSSVPFIPGEFLKDRPDLWDIQDSTYFI